MGQVDQFLRLTKYLFWIFVLWLVGITIFLTSIVFLLVGD